MIKQITVIGGGSTGHAASAFLTAKGFEVTLCDHEGFERELRQVEEAGGILLHGRAGRGIYMPARVTHDFKLAVESAQLIMVCVPAARHGEVAERIAPWMKGGQSVLIVPGNLGSFLFQETFKRCNVPEDVIIAEMEGNLCPCRLSPPAEVTVGLPIRTKKVAALPGSKTAEFIERNQGVLDFAANRHVLEGALLSDNYVLHIGTSLLASSTIDQMGEEFILFQHGLTDYAVHCTECIRQERIRLLAQFGLEERDSATEFFRGAAGLAKSSRVRRVPHPEGAGQLKAPLCGGGRRGLRVHGPLLRRPLRRGDARAACCGHPGRRGEREGLL